MPTFNVCMIHSNLVSNLGIWCFVIVVINSGTWPGFPEVVWSSFEYLGPHTGLYLPLIHGLCIISTLWDPELTHPESITNSICFAYHFSLDFAMTIPYSHIPCSHRAIIVGVMVTLFQRLINLSPMTKTSPKWNNKLKHLEMWKSLLDFLPCPPIVISCNTLTEIFLNICYFHFYGKGFLSMIHDWHHH